MTPEEVKELFKGNRFGPPCIEARIVAAEAELQVAIPAELRRFYESFDGFLGPTAAYFFWPLFAISNQGDIGFVEQNKWLRTSFEFPKKLTTQCLFFGDDGCGLLWAVHQQIPGKVIAWEGALGDEFRIVSTDPGDIWARTKEQYERACG